MTHLECFIIIALRPKCLKIHLMLSLLLLLLMLALLLTRTRRCFFSDCCLGVGSQVLSFRHVTEIKNEY